MLKIGLMQRLHYGHPRGMVGGLNTFLNSYGIRRQGGYGLIRRINLALSIMVLLAAVLATVRPAPVRANPSAEAQLLSVLPLASESRGIVSTYQVQEGDSLQGIAELLSVDVNTLQDLNDLPDPNQLAVGRILMVPDSPTAPGHLAAAPVKRSVDPVVPVFVWPAFGPITTKFGVPGPDWIDGFHMGLDIGASAGSPIVAAADGIVLDAQFDHNHGYGNYVLVDHGNGYQTLYGHMSQIVASVDRVVHRGDLIGYVGSTGWAHGPHLHFEIRLRGTKIDPQPFLP